MTMRIAAMALMLLSAACSTSGGLDGDGKKTIISVRENIRVLKWNTGGKADGVPWSVQKDSLHGGKQEGVDVIIVNNGKITFAICPTRGMGILWARTDNVLLGWNSPVKEVVHPRHINLKARGGLGWLDGFNEWMARCGLESVGGPGTDPGPEGGNSLDVTLHGKIGNLPAQEVEVVIDKKAPYTIRVRGIVHERMFYGPKLELKTEISTVPGSTSIRVTDVVTNFGPVDQEFQVLYHTNYGAPLLQKGATWSAPMERVIPQTDDAAKGLKTMTTYAGPKKDYREQVFCIIPKADKKGRTLAMLRNRNGNVAASIAWSVKEVPYLTVWKMTTAKENGYVTGIEPGTSFPNNRRVERKYGRVPKLAPGASWTATVDFGIHEGKAAVMALEKKIATIQGNTPPRIEPEPENKD